MGKVRYKEISESLSKLTKPEVNFGRSSIGLEKNVGEYYYIDVNDLIPFKNQARKHFPLEEIESLAQSIKQHGIRHPLTVIPYDGEKGKYEVVSGERRLRAAKVAGLDKVPCILLKDKNLAEEIAIIENIHRQDLHPVELGTAFNYLLKNKIFESQSQLANRLSISESKVSELLQYSQMSYNLKQFAVENNITNRDKLRKLAKMENKKLGVEELPEVLKSLNPTKNFSIIRLSFNNGNIISQLNGVKKLDHGQKMKLKEELNKIIEHLK
ncbi:hypothetical protein NF27_DJ00030 [Candidatus Jidaibacter acanthamoeba]|uniref:Probable chromosome-partitioning protein ParB n=1 Tax=Candidatus Jidaibacter acanthamoebae TaxID=86105 RepID=A0A0C1N062_9RICK|nr:ParB/RepB/Spo0J family partition protein [Candidatus Jidaibacter acanthamoeba]KIE05706.1 hypothetical protein NF27_DJ00030 [Candidatus Jidaibacter acanthamoeba]MBA8667326.1 ParB/RepB/Spo0J family partition protein [Holosporaceae bacterium 'Namur']